MTPPLAPSLPPALASRHLLSLRDLDADTWHGLLAAAELLSGPAGRQPRLAGRRFGMLFMNPSLRTRTAFEVACYDLGALAVYLQPGAGLWQLEFGRGRVMDGAAAEHVSEAIGSLGRMLDGLGVRAFAGLRDAVEDAAEPILATITAVSPVPVLNLESALDHPHQGLADALALRRCFPGRKLRINVRWAPHVKPLPMAVPHAAALAFAHEGHDVVLSHPKGCELDGDVAEAVASLARRSGGSWRVTHERDEALDGAHVVYAKSWGPRAHYGDSAATEAFLSAHRDWIVRADELRRGQAVDARRRGPGACFMHCLPVRRGVVVEDAVLDGPGSLVLEQAAARLDVQKATLCRACGVEP